MNLFWLRACSLILVRGGRRQLEHGQWWRQCGVLGSVGWSVTVRWRRRLVTRRAAIVTGLTVDVTSDSSDSIRVMLTWRLWQWSLRHHGRHGRLLRQDWRQWRLAEGAGGGGTLRVGSVAPLKHNKVATGSTPLGCGQCRCWWSVEARHSLLQLLC